MNLQSSSCKEFKALSSQLRLRMLPYFEKARTVKQVADALGLKPHTMYHHVRVLEECGIVRLVRTVKHNGSIEEKFFQLTAKFNRHRKAIKLSGAARNDALELTMSIIKEYEDCSCADSPTPCHSGVKRITVNSKDSAKIHRSMKTSLEKLFKEYLKAYSTPDGDATLVLNIFGFIK